MSRIRWSGALAAVAALIALVAMGPPGTARAATGTGYDQITGAGSTNSALTVPWTQGLLDNTNKPIASANADRGSATPTSPLSFMYPDFKSLQVTVSQTQDIAHQGITVTWTGGQPTVNNDGVQANFLQLMECYGDASSGPSPQGCEFGSRGLIAAGTINASVGSREGGLCTPGGPSVTNPPGSLDGSSPIDGCDPEEPGSATPTDVAPGNPDNYSIPFVPVDDPTNPAYGPVATSQYFDQFSTNEVQEAVTGSNDGGRLQFETLTGVEAPSLGCGMLESNGQIRNCWLVIVPRGLYEPNGFKIPNPSASQPNDYLYSSPLSASNWAMRIQIHLGYAPVGTFCPIGTQEVQTVGTQIVARAVQSWQLALNAAAKCRTVYGYSAVPEATSTQQLSLPGSPAGLAFTTIPIGSEAARPGGSGGSVSLPPILYAPVAVSAVGFGFNINEAKGYVSTPVELTPELLAKGLTQVYQYDLPDVYPGQPVPSWAQKNPTNISNDSQFIKLNPDVPSYGFSSIALAPLLTEDHSALNQQVWEWIQGDPAATAWLDNGTTDATNSVTADPDYVAINPQLGTPGAIDSFPRAYSGVLDLGLSSSGKEETRHSLDLLPYVNSYDQAAANVLTGNTGTTGTWSDQAIAPDGSTGWWQKNPPESLGQTFIWGISDTADLAKYGLIDAQLCDDTGGNCVVPSVASLTTALNSAKPDSAGLLQVNPASPGTGGYPLTQVTYAAVDTTRPAADLTAYASLIAYAAGTGQTPGVVPGDLPPGYLPLPANLKAQAQSVVKQLVADAHKSKPSASPSPSTTTSAGGTSGTTTPTASPGTGTITPPVSSPTPTVGLSISPPSAQLAATRTARQPVGAIRWALIAVVIAGALCAAGGTVLRSDSVARWLRGLRT